MFLIANVLLLAAEAQQNYWQQKVSYTIDVTLNDKENSLDGFEQIEYTNNSPDTLHFIWFHLWPNAYKNDKTVYSDQMLDVVGDTKFYFSDKEQRGYINKLDFKADNITAETEDHPNYIDIIKIILPTPLVPGGKTKITTPFHVKLPFNFSRGGYDGETYQLTQWYPKPAVYDKNGWHPMPYLDQGEYYSEFGSFDVRITVPKNYVVAATGELQNADEKAWLLTRNNFSWEPIKHKIKNKTGSVKIITQQYPASSSEIKTIEYKQGNIHDFAWFADKRFIVNHDTIQLASGRVIDAYTYYTTAQKEYWNNSIHFCKNAIRYYSSLVGEYPYNIVSAVQGPNSFGGGMEYPTITVISPEQSVKDLDLTIAHEVGHNWFYGVLATNEREHPWMDEGINTYYEDQYQVKYYGATDNVDRTFFETFAEEKTDQPIETTADKFNSRNYSLVAYYKTSAWIAYLKSVMGDEVFNKAMQHYFQQWQFKHPQPEDFKKSLEESSGQNLDSAFALLYKKGDLPGGSVKKWKVINTWQAAEFTKDNILFHPAKNMLIVGPAIGVNSYDKLMAGIMLTNFKLPPVPFQFFLAPIYSTGAKKFTGLGVLSYHFFPQSKSIYKINIFLNGSAFTQDQFTDDNGKKTFLGYTKLVPGFRITAKEHNPQSTLKRYLQWKTFFFTEEGLRFSRDTVINGTDTSIVNAYNKTNHSRYLNQLIFSFENSRVLYPWSGQLKIEQANDFVRAAFTGNYFFNYAKTGGLNVRLFAGKFFYLGEKTITKQFNNDRYDLNMTGANGYEDYTYSDYFLGRNRFDKFPSQQIMIRDGGFKVRTDLLADKVGKTDNWLMAANFTSS
ncbi:MAG: M1 family metallopeptidase, partial [Bacteroidetes bacterium]|nr:M1 family metallopeptidase [Bacteroidota bacterium]